MRLPKPPNDPNRESKSELTEADQKALLEQAIQKQERLAESQLEMAKLFFQKRNSRIALRRLKEIVSEFGDSEAAKEAKTILKKLKP
jgi:outer membrane protein assembly factor BamD (BamD/ComL family)